MLVTEINNELLAPAAVWPAAPPVPPVPFLKPIPVSSCRRKTQSGVMQGQLKAMLECININIACKETRKDSVEARYACFVKEEIEA
jgi:hypothetical protein